MPIEPSIPMWITFALIAAAMAFYASERTPLELTAFGLVSVMAVLFQVFPVMDAGGKNLLGVDALLMGFANPALITVMALMVVGQAIVRTRALDFIATAVIWTTRGHWRWTIYLLLFVAMVVSAFTNNTPQIIVFIPIMQAIAHRLSLSASKVMMPLNMAVVLGGMPVLIGTSTNLLAAGSHERLTGQVVGMFDFAVVGSILAAVGFVYAVTVAAKFLPAREGSSRSLVGEVGKQYLTQIAVTERSRLAGATAVNGAFPGLPGMTVQVVQRGEHAELPPFENVTLRSGDVLVVAVTRQSLTEAVLIDPGLSIDLGPERTDEANGDGKRLGQQVLAEVMVAPASRMIGQNLEMIGFRRLYNCIVVGVQRRSRMIRTQISEIRLEAGDVLLIQGHRQDIRALRANPDVVLMEWSAHELPAPHLARRVAIIFGLTVLAITFQIVPMAAAALAGATAMVAFRCINVRQAARSIERHIYCLVGSSIALSTALEATQGSTYLAQTMESLLGPDASPAIVLSGFFLLVAILSNLLNHNAVALLFTPIGIDLANRIGVDPMVFTGAVIFAANCSFATPIGYQTNLMIMTPGHYKFIDFVRAGTPLVILLWVTYSIVAPWYYGLS